MTITTIQQVPYNWFEWPNIISFLVAMVGLAFGIASVVLLMLDKASVKVTSIIFFVGVIFTLTGVIWGIADDATSEVIYERVVHQVVDRAP